ncbi:hypothetical protein ACFLXU_05145 [Chloroflexota bacterium]
MIEHIPGAHLIQEIKDPLNKKFQCKHCGNLFRTRQGLSGHIQFKHGTKQNALAIAAKDILDIKIKLKTVEGIMNLPKPTTQMINAILDNWLNVVYICASAGIDLNKQDFKNYFVARIADMYQS